jgi:chromosome segregation ATPase
MSCSSGIPQRKEAELDEMRRFYEDKLSEMKARVAQLEVQRDSIIVDLKSSVSSLGGSFNGNEGASSEHDELSAKLKETEKQLADLRSKQRDLERISEIKIRMSREVSVGWRGGCPERTWDSWSWSSLVNMCRLQL